MHKMPCRPCSTKFNNADFVCYMWWVYVLHRRLSVC